MTSRSAALLSNDLIYSSMAVFTLAFFAHALEVAWSVKAPTKGKKKTNLDFARTEKIGRIATAMMILGFVLLLAGVIFRGISASRVPWGNMYEFSITGALAFTGVYLFTLLPAKCATGSSTEINLVGYTCFCSNYFWRCIFISKLHCRNIFNYGSL